MVKLTDHQKMLLKEAQEELWRGCHRCCGGGTIGGKGMECSVLQHPEIKNPPRPCLLPRIWGRLDDGSLKPAEVTEAFVEQNRAQRDEEGRWSVPTRITYPDGKHEEAAAVEHEASAAPKHEAPGHEEAA